jgi:hypothetical protein
MRKSIVNYGKKTPLELLILIWVCARRCLSIAAFGQRLDTARLHQVESRSISENSKWGIRRRYESGKFGMSTKRFIGYDMDDKRPPCDKSQAS